MIKHIYIIRGFKSESYKEFSDRIIKSIVEIANIPGIWKLKVVYTVEAPPALSVIPFRNAKMATISVYKEDQKPLDQWINMEGFSGAYKVTEALPVSYEKTWPDGEMTPGICLLTLFNRKKGISYETFIHRWHNSHTPLSLKIHPLWNYSRNVVENLITDNSAPFEGIVEEQMRTDSDLLNPFRFFGNPLVIIPRMIAVYRDTKSFLNYDEIETYMAREVVVKS
jgi:hypothetical protein